MASLGRLTNAIVAANNENTIQLAGFNIDFSLLKVEAPKEFTGLGAVLSRQRKVNAEDGPLHRTARKLGALFEQLLPSTPNLIRAYGKRATEIFQAPGVNPQGSQRDGPFEKFVGADGGSIWAAATSGQSAVAVHLLACMLARKWESHVAISIWMEIVAERKKEIEIAFNGGNVASMTVIFAAGQDMTREELGLWDDSARAWLQSADGPKISELKQLELILKNVESIISSEVNTYTSVLSAWKRAMMGLEQILSGVPQQISDGSVLLSLSAWHLFPDLLVLGSNTANVKFGDNLVPVGGVITIGLQSIDPGQGKIKWSLALSHLRYYGDPVKVTSGDVKSRVSMRQLYLAALGSVLARWGAPIEEVIPLSKWFVTLWSRLNMASAQDKRLWCKSVISDSLHEHLPWLYVLVEAAKDLLACKGEKLDVALMIVGFGHRRETAFLGIAERPSSPLFGLCNRLVLSALQKQTNVDRGIQYFRGLSESIGYEDGDAFIRFLAKHDVGNEIRGNLYHLEYASAVPHTIIRQKRHIDGKVKNAQIFWRSLSSSEDADEKCNCDGECGPNCACVSGRRLCNWNCHGDSCFDIRVSACQNSSQGLKDRVTEIFGKGESCGTYGRSLHGPFREIEGPSGAVMVWDNPPLLFSNLPKISCTPSIRLLSSMSAVRQPCCCYDSCHMYMDPKSDSNSDQANVDSEQEVYHSVAFDLRPSNSTIKVASENTSPNLRDFGFQLWVKRNCDGTSHPKLSSRPEPADLRVTTRKATEILLSVDPGGLLEYITQIAGGETRPDSAIPLLLEMINPLEPSFVRALETLSVSSQVYQDLKGATVPLGIMSMDLGCASWMHKSASAGAGAIARDGSGKPLLQLSRAQAFACIMMFESGALNIEPENLTNIMAISSGNSIFVPKALLSDPFEDISKHELQRIVGNIGMPGITLLVCPQNPRVRGLSDDFRVVRHAKYDFKREDNFKETTLHLFFTNWKLPLDDGTGSWGNIDKRVHYVESVASVHDRGVWVADIDLVNDSDKIWLLTSCNCLDQDKQILVETSMAMRLTSVDSWDEFLDSPKGIGVFRARGNWVARLAAASILGKRSKVDRACDTSIFVGPTFYCLQCARKIASYGTQPDFSLGRKEPFFLID